MLWQRWRAFGQSLGCLSDLIIPNRLTDRPQRTLLTSLVRKGNLQIRTPPLKCAVESQHGGTATLAQSVPVKEVFDGKTVWHLASHPKATRAYAWSSPVEGSTKRRFLCRAARKGYYGASGGGTGCDCRGTEGEGTLGMNLRRGFIRIWIVAAALWAVFGLWQTDAYCLLGLVPYDAKNPECYGLEIRIEALFGIGPPPPTSGDPELDLLNASMNHEANIGQVWRLFRVLAFIFGVPLLAGAAGIAIAWAVRGFESSSPSN